MAAAVVQSKGLAGASGTQTRTLTFDSPVTAGNLIAVCFAQYSGQAPIRYTSSNIVDNKSNTYRFVAGTDASQGVAWFIARAVTGGSSFQVSITPPASDYVTLVAVEVSGIPDTAEIDAVGVGISTGGSMASLVAPLRTDEADCLLLGGASTGAVPQSVSAPATQLQEPDDANSTSVSLNVASQAAASAGSHSMTWTRTANVAAWRAAVIAIRSASVGGGGGGGGVGAAAPPIGSRGVMGF